MFSKGSFSEVSLEKIPGTSVKIDVKQLNGSQKIQERKKSKDAQKCAEYISKQFPWVDRQV